MDVAISDGHDRRWYLVFSTWYLQKMRRRSTHWSPKGRRVLQAKYQLLSTNYWLLPPPATLASRTPSQSLADTPASAPKSSAALPSSPPTLRPTPQRAHRSACPPGRSPR